MDHLVHGHPFQPLTPHFGDHGAGDFTYLASPVTYGRVGSDHNLYLTCIYALLKLNWHFHTCCKAE